MGQERNKYQEWPSKMQEARYCDCVACQDIRKYVEEQKMKSGEVVWNKTVYGTDDGTKVVLKCGPCNEDIVHIHKPTKPTYEELVAYIANLTNTVSFSNVQYSIYQELVKRICEGR